MRSLLAFFKHRHRVRVEQKSNDNIFVSMKYLINKPFLFFSNFMQTILMINENGWFFIFES